MAIVLCCAMLVKEKVLACPYCQTLNGIEHLNDTHDAFCSRCEAPLWYAETDSLNRTLSLTVAALICYILANAFPLLTIHSLGIHESDTLLSITIMLYEKNTTSLAVLVLLTSEVIPLLTMLAALYLLVPIKFNRTPFAKAHVYQALKQLEPWSMASVFLMGILIASTKLQDLADINLGIALYSLVFFIILHTAAKRTFSPELVWPILPTPLNPQQPFTLKGQKLAACPYCKSLMPHQHSVCPRCTMPLPKPNKNTTQHTWCFILSAIFLLIPANFYPIMQISYLGTESADTILSGIIHLIDSGMWPLALVVLIASFIVPMCKIISLIFLSLSVQRKSQWRPKDRSRLYRVNQVIGSWSMVDIYVVAILTSLLNMNVLAYVRPDIGALFFAAAVISTILATHSFNPERIWNPS